MQSISYPEKNCPFIALLFRKTCRPEDETPPLAADLDRPAAVFRFPEYPDLDVHYHSSIFKVPQVWDDLAKQSPALLRRSFLEAIEAAPPSGMDFHYLLFLRHGEPLGIAYFQLLHFEPDRSLKLDKPFQVSNWQSFLKKKIARRLRHTLLVAGNTLLTGQHAYAFLPDLVPSLQAQLVQKASWQLAAHLRRQTGAVDSILHKDIGPSQLSSYSSWQQSGYHALPFQPNMELVLRPEWSTFADYLNTMNSKYRVRARRAAKKGEGLERRWLTPQEVCLHSEQLYALYQQIAGQSDFNLVHLHPEFFYQMKKQLGDQFEVLAYFQEGRLVGFCTLLHHGERAEAHFLGFEEEVNRSTQLYLNMLYDMIRAGIEKRRKKIGFARTAMEIKSSVGAEPEYLYVIARSYHPLTNRLLPAIVRLLAPKVHWEQRHPFR